MDKKEELLVRIITIEWGMFQKTSNIGGRAECQEDIATFNVMRYCQGLSWSEDTLKSYLNDLEEAQTKDRNLLSEKYARMMESTSPLEYQQIKHLIPRLDSEVPPLIEKITGITLAWEAEIQKKFPYVRGKGRPVYKSEDKPGLASFETYLRCELATYSKQTLQFYYQNVLEQKMKNINGSELVLGYTIKRYGYKSLQEANEKLKTLA